MFTRAKHAFKWSTFVGSQRWPWYVALTCGKMASTFSHLKCNNRLPQGELLQAVPLRTRPGPSLSDLEHLKESVKTLARVRQHMESKWRLRPQYIPWRSSSTGQIVACRSCENMSQALVSGYEVFQGNPCGGADLHWEQTEIESVHYSRIHQSAVSTLKTVFKVCFRPSHLDP